MVGMAVLALIFGMVVTGCEPEPGGSGDPSFPEAEGKLFINGLDSFNDKYVYIQGLVRDRASGGSDVSKVLVGLTDVTGYPSDIAYKLAKISSGKAEVPLYTANPQATSYENSYIAYDGDGSITSINIIILNESSLQSSNAATAINSNLGMRTITSGRFSRGNITLDWETGSLIWVPTYWDKIIQMIENQWVSSDVNPRQNYWFTFTATASTHYIHIKNGKIMGGFLLRDNNGGNGGNHYPEEGKVQLLSDLYPGEKYYISVGTWVQSNFDITFNTSETPPN